MVRLIHATTRVVVTVSDALATRLGSEWQPVEPEKPAKRQAKAKK